MNAERRIIPRKELSPPMHRPRANEPGLQCHATIDLDGTTYRCGREVIGRARTLRYHEGIHDAFVEHGDQGAVRW